MQRLRAWLVRGASFDQLFNNLIGIILLVAVTSEIGHTIGQTFFAEGLSSGTVKDAGDAIKYFGSLVGVVLGAVLLGPPIEEILFRLIPLGVPVWVIWKFTRDRFAHIDIYVTVSLLIVVSVYFGYIHGNWGNVFIQGPTGFVFGLVFLKMSYYGERIFRGLLASTLLHMSVNGFAILGFFLREFLGKIPLLG